jgi:hypothetical protein
MRDWVHDLLDIEEVDSLILRCITTKGKTFSDIGKSILNALAKIAVEQAGFCRRIIYELTGIRTELYDSALIHNDHTLSFVNCYDGAVGDYVLHTLGIAVTSIGYPLLSFYYQYIVGKRITVEILSPLVSHHAADCIFCCSD